MLDPTSRLRIVLLGYLVRGPIGGMAWHHLNYLIGLRQLGHEVLFVEDSDDYPACYDPRTHAVGTNPDYGIAYADRVFQRLGMGNDWAYHDAHQSAWLGPAAKHAVQFCETADMALNISGVNPLRPWLMGIPHRVLVDTDPGFTQVKGLICADFRALIERHTAHFSFGELIHSGSTGVPNDGIVWHATRQPVVMDQWPFDPQGGRRFNTVMQWQSYPPVEYNGQFYGTKKESFTLIEELPQRISTELEVALGGASAPRERLRTAGWRLRDPIEAAPDPWQYQQYIQQSRGELSVAKHGYATTRCGWFSERSACYLASGRPVVVQETGFSDFLPTGCGLHAFETEDEAVDAILKIDSNYPAEASRAREIAHAYFRSDLVLHGLLELLA